MKVSIVIPSYNHEKFINHAVQSALNQSYQNFEIIIIDDKSIDSSEHVIQKFTDTRIKFFKNLKNLGAVVTLNKMLSLCSGEYIALLNSDDIWEKDKLEKQVAFLDKNTHIGAVFSHAHIIDEEDKIFTNNEHFYYSIFDQPNRTRHEWLNYFFYQGNAICHPSMLIRKECYVNCGMYQDSFVQLPDYDMWLRLCLKYEIHILPEKLTSFRILENEANTSSNTPKNNTRTTIEHFYIIKKFLASIPKEDLYKIFPEALKYHNKNGLILEFILAMVALGEKTNKSTKLLGFILLHELINNSKTRKLLQTLYNFNYRNLSEMAAKHPIFISEYIPKLHIQLFQDIGEGIKEENSMKFPIHRKMELQEFTFPLSNTQDLHLLRLDPLNEPCVIKITELTLITNHETINLFPYLSSNGCLVKNDTFYFETNDSNIYITNLKFDDAKALKIQLKYLYMEAKALPICMKETSIALHKTKIILDNSIQELAQNNQKLDTILNSKIWKLSTPLQKFIQLIRQKK